MIKINVDGKTLEAGSIEELEELDALLVSLDSASTRCLPTFTAQLARVVDAVRENGFKEVHISITSSQVGQKIVHDFDIVAK